MTPDDGDDVIIVSGSPRSGTARVAAMLGFRHEHAFCISGETPLIREPLEPEVSWLAAPHLAGHTAIHLVRDPWDTVASIVARAFLRPDNVYGRYAYRYVRTWDPWLFWLRWTAMVAEQAQATIRLEITYNYSMLAASSIAALVNAGGQAGVGDWRPNSPKSLTGVFGRFAVDTTRQARQMAR